MIAGLTNKDMRFSWKSCILEKQDLHPGFSENLSQNTDPIVIEVETQTFTCFMEV